MAESILSTMAPHQLRVSPVVYFFLALTTLLVPLRCFVRIHMMAKFGIDDWFLVLAQCLMIAGGAIALTIMQHEDDPVPTFPLARLIWVNEAVYTLLVLSIRLAIGLLLLRILAFAYRTRKLVNWVMIISAGNTILFLVWTALGCRPLTLFWPEGVGRQCHEHAFVVIGYVNSITSVLTQLTFAVLPVVLVFQLRIVKPYDRVAVSVVLACGACAAIAACIRVAYVGIILSGNWFVTDDSHLNFTWAVVENGLAISAASLATFRPLLTAVTTAIFGPPDELEGGLMRKPSTYAYAHNELCQIATARLTMMRQQHGGSVPEFSDILLAQIEADAIKDEAKFWATTPRFSPHAGGPETPDTGTPRLPRNVDEKRGVSEEITEIPMVDVEDGREKQ